ncbi:MAG: hypothetical protein AAB883_00630, partial [Patescibacteria group bacterium]
VLLWHMWRGGGVSKWREEWAMLTLLTLLITVILSVAVHSMRAMTGYVEFNADQLWLLVSYPVFGLILFFTLLRKELFEH